MILPRSEESGVIGGPSLLPLLVLFDGREDVSLCLDEIFNGMEPQLEVASLETNKMVEKIQVLLVYHVYTSKTTRELTTEVRTDFSLSVLEGEGERVMLMEAR